MTPTTPTGKRHAARADRPYEGYSAITSREIAAIEVEAAAAERERLRALMTDMALSLGWSHDLYSALVSWLAEPDAE